MSALDKIHIYIYIIVRGSPEKDIGVSPTCVGDIWEVCKTLFFMQQCSVFISKHTN